MTCETSAQLRGWDLRAVCHTVGLWQSTPLSVVNQRIGPLVTPPNTRLRHAMTALEVFAAFGAQLVEAAVHPHVLHHAKRAVVDWYAALLPGAVQAPAVLLEQATHLTGVGESYSTAPRPNPNQPIHNS